MNQMFTGQLTWTTIVEELIAIPVIYLLAIALGKILKRHAGVKLGILYQCFCVVLALWIPLEIFNTQFVSRHELLKLGRSASILFGAFFAIAIFKRYFWELWYEQKQHKPAPKFLSQIFAILAVIAAVFLIISGVYGQNIQGVVFGSTIVVGIVGFAMQDLLGNIIAGIALEIGKPFKPGDWLVVENQHALVLEVNWRSTRLRNTDNIHFDIPNKSIVGATITNLTNPHRLHALRILVGFDYHSPPNTVKDLLTLAASTVPGVIQIPPPRAYLKNFGDSSISYELKFSIEDESRFSEIHDGIRTNIWYLAKRQGLVMPFPIRTIQIDRPKTRHQESLLAARATIRKQPFVQLLDENQVDELLNASQLLRFGIGEVIIKQGQPGDSMFIILSGQAVVSVSVGTTETVVATIHAGDHFGEMSLLTGEPRSATVTAQTDCETCEIPKSLVASLLQKNTGLLQQLSELLAQRRMRTEGILSTSTETAQIISTKRNYTANFLNKLSTFFEI